MRPAFPSTPFHCGVPSDSQLCATSSSVVRALFALFRSWPPIRRTSVSSQGVTVLIFLFSSQTLSSLPLYHNTPHFFVSHPLLHPPRLHQYGLPLPSLSSPCFCLALPWCLSAHQHILSPFVVPHSPLQFAIAACNPASPSTAPHHSLQFFVTLCNPTPPSATPNHFLQLHIIHRPLRLSSSSSSTIHY